MNRKGRIITSMPFRRSCDCMDQISIQVNGKNEQIPKGTTVRQHLESKGIGINVVACELNMKILKRATLGDIQLNEGDVLEVIQMIGGG